LLSTVSDHLASAEFVTEFYMAVASARCFSGTVPSPKP
jgi:hypothetical protein